MLRKTMVVLAALLAVGLGQMALQGGPIAMPDQAIRLAPGPIPSYGTDAGYPFQDVVAQGNGYMYGPTGYGSYSMGYEFKPIKNGAVTKIGRYRGSYDEASTVKLWDAANSAQLASASVSGTNWSYVDITPVMVEAGHEYFITTYGGSYVYYWYQNTYPIDMDDVTLEHGAYAVGDACPIYNGGGYFYGCADIYFEPWPATENWTGAVSTDWAADGNWDGAHAPVVGIVVSLPGGCSNYPTTNSGSSYGAKTLDIAEGASLTIVSGKPLTCTGDFTNAGTFQADGDVTCKAGLLNNAGGEFTVSVGATLNSKGDIYNAGTMTNGGHINCPLNFTNGGTFTSGTYSELHLTGSADATFDGGSLDAGTGLYNLFVEKVPLDCMLGNEAISRGYYWGGSTTTIIAENPSTVAGTISKWACYVIGTAGVECRIYRAGYGGYEWGMVNRSASHTPSSGYNEWTEDITGCEVGDRVAIYTGGYCVFDLSGAMLIYWGDANPGGNGWSNYGYGPISVCAWISQPAGDVTTTGDVAIAGDLMINDGNDLIVNGSSHYSASGMWTDNGAFHPGAGTVTFDGESQIAGTAAAEFNNLGITGTLFAPSYMTVNGNWACSGTFDNGSGTVELKGGSITSGGQPFSKLIVNNTSDGDVTVLDDIAVNNTLTLTSGNFLLGPHTLTLGTTGAAGTALVNGGLFSVVGTGASAKGTVTAAAAGRPYSFTVNTGAGIAAKYANFTWMGANGIDIKSGATINATNNFSWTSFTAGNTVGTMLKIANAQTIDDIANTSFFGTAGYNIDYAAGTGHLTVTDGAGERWGADFENDPSDKVDWATSILHDVGVTAILAPSGTVGEHLTVFPRLTVKNYGEVAEEFDVRVIISDATDAELFNHVEHVTGLAIGETRNFVFTNSWDPTPQGPFHVLARSELAGDRHPENDMVEQDFAVGPPYAPGWHLQSQMPAGAKQPKDGAWLAYDAGSLDGTGLIYASRGTKQPDFYSYDPAGNVWKLLAPWQLGTEGKMPSKGSVGCADGNGVIYATKGNNKSGFWKYTAATNAWTQLKDVPLGLSNKKVKGGTSIVWAMKGGVGSPFLLKGYKNEFYRYNVATDAWQTLTAAPGVMPKWDKGSFLVSDGANTLYASKAKYNEFYSYNTETDSWSGPLTGMPTYGSGGHKKAKDGSCAAYSGSVFAFKGGNTQEFWQSTFTTDGNSWTERDTLPRGVFRKKVKAGAGMVAVGTLLFATKGNNCSELWMYVPSSFLSEAPAPQHDGVLAGKTVIAQGMSISPNPLAAGFAALRYGLPKAGAARLSVYNMAGQTVMTRTLAASRSGNVSLDLRHLSNGVYLVKLSSDGFENSQKLVVQR